MQDYYLTDIEANYENQLSIKNSEKLKLFGNSAKAHLKSKKPVTIRIATQDIEAIKIKASRCGLPYQTYISMLIHLNAVKLWIFSVLLNLNQEKNFRLREMMINTII